MEIKLKIFIGEILACFDWAVACMRVESEILVLSSCEYGYGPFGQAPLFGPDESLFLYIKLLEAKPSGPTADDLEKINNKNLLERLDLARNLKERGNQFYTRGLKKLGFDSYFFATKFLRLKSKEISEIEDEMKKNIQDLRCNLYRNIASFYYSEKLWTQVIHYCDQALEINENCIISLCKRSSAYAILNRFDESDTDYQKALKLDEKKEHATLMTSCRQTYNKFYTVYKNKATEIEKQMSKGVIKS